MLHNSFLIKIALGILLLNGLLHAGIISTLSGDMSSAVSTINSKVSSVMGDYKSLNSQMKSQMNENKNLYSQRLENFKIIFNKNKELEAYLKYLNFEFQKNRDLEAKRKKNQNILLISAEK